VAARYGCEGKGRAHRKRAADHLLCEVLISLGEYDKAIASASDVINSGVYRLMTSRFGSEKERPGDVFSDLFRDGNQNRSSGNLESIYVWQIEENTQGGGGTVGKQYAPKLGTLFSKHKIPDGISMLITDSMGRGVGRSRLSPHTIYTIWGEQLQQRHAQLAFQYAQGILLQQSCIRAVLR
jgi:hypothetical protein